jgi:hypothetical protein
MIVESNENEVIDTFGECLVGSCRDYERVLSAVCSVAGVGVSRRHGILASLIRLAERMADSPNELTFYISWLLARSGRRASDVTQSLVEPQCSVSPVYLS